MPVPDELRRYVPRTDLYDSLELVHYHMPVEQPPTTASYIIFKKGSKTYAKNGAYGHIEFEDTDAAKVIQQAIDALPSTGGKILFKTGMYEIGQTIILNKPMVFAGENVGATPDTCGACLRLKDNANCELLKTEWAAFIRITNLFFDGNRDNQTEEHSMLLIEDTCDIYIDHVFLRWGKLHGIEVKSPSRQVWNIFIHNVAIEDMLGMGIRVHAYPNVIERSYILNNFVWGTVQLLYNCKGILACNNYVQNIGIWSGDYCEISHNTVVGVLTLNHATHNIVTGNLCIGNNIGISVEEGCDYNIIIGNDVSTPSTPISIASGSNIHGIIKDNIGYVTENSGTATIPSGQTSVTVEHGLAGTPTIVFIEVNHDELKDYKITNKTSTQFTVEVPNAVSADRTFGWRVWYKP